MSIFIKKSDLKVKNPTTGTYQGQSLFTENDIQTQINRINSAGTTQVNAVNAKGQETLASIPDDYTELSDDVNNLKSELNNQLNVAEIQFTHGAYIKTDAATVDVSAPTTNVGYRYAVVPCKEGDYFEINVDGAGGARAFAFVKSTGDKIYSTGSNAVIRATTRAPKDSAYLVINCKESADYIPSYKGLLNRYAVTSIKNKSNAGLFANNEIPFSLLFEVCGLAQNAGVVIHHHSLTNRAALAPDSYIFARAGSRIYVNNSESTAQFFVVEKDIDGTISQNSWTTDYIATKNIYVMPCLRYSDDSEIVDVDAMSKLLTFDLAPRPEKPDLVGWKNEWFIDGSHRGYMEEAPQSTVAAYVRAKVHGYNLGECDLRKTSDGHFVVHHDTAMPSSSSYYIYLHTLEELRTNANMGEYNGITQQILEFKDLLQLAKQLDMRLLVELKYASGNEGSKFTAEDIVELVDTVKKFGMLDRVIWMGSADSTDHAYGQKFRDADSNCYLAIIDSTNANAVSPFVLEDRPERTMVYARTTYITDTVVENFANIGVGVIAWAVTFSWLYPDYTEDQIKAEIRRCIKCGIIGIVLDKWTASELVREEYADYL